MVELIHGPDNIYLIDPEKLYVPLCLFKVLKNGVSVPEHLINAHWAGLDVHMSASLGNNHHIFLAF